MIQSKHLLIILIPAILLALFAFGIRIIEFNNTKQNTAVTQTQTTPVQDKNIPIFAEDPIIGNKKAPNTLIVFADFGCEGCQLQHTLFNQLLQKHPDRVKIIWKGLAVTKFPYDSTTALNYGHCANQNNVFPEFSDLAYTNYLSLSPVTLQTIIDELKLDKEKFLTCVDSAETKTYNENNKQIAEIFNIQSVPTIFFNDKQIGNPESLEQWEAVLGI